MSESLIVQQPSQAARLILLFHGVGADAHDMAPLGQLLANACPDAFVVCVASPDPCDMGAGWQWFSVSGVTEHNRVARVEAAMPAFLATVRHWQQRSEVGSAATVLVGFSQGAIMALESTRGRAVPAGQVISLAGRFALLPEAAPVGVRFGFLHGQNDQVIPHQHAQTAAQRLRALGVEVTLELFADTGHGINAVMLEALLRQLRI